MSVEFRLLKHILDQVPVSEHDEVRAALQPFQLRYSIEIQLDSSKGSSVSG
jgi:hypothetical protein